MCTPTVQTYGHTLLDVSYDYACAAIIITETFMFHNTDLVFVSKVAIKPDWTKLIETIEDVYNGNAINYHELITK